MNGCANTKLDLFLSRLLWFGVGAWLIGGCALLPPVEGDEAGQGEFAHVLPISWEAISDWQPVNLDGDEEDESLLFFRYDNGQVGALIQEGVATTSIATPDRLLPRNFDEQAALGQGMIAPPGTTAREIALAEVSGKYPETELVILGGGTHLTFVWWKGENLGYGVTQLYAAGGFGVDWEKWQDDPAPLVSILAYEPLQDYRARANLCHVALYARRTDLPPDLPAITFTREPQGLHFCDHTVPAHPFAPEGVVMAYLVGSRGENGLDHLLTPGTTLAQVDAESAAERWTLEIVTDIAAYQTLPMAQTASSASLSPTTTVCVEFAERGNLMLRRWVVYTLRLQLAVPAQQLPEQWTLSGAFTEPQPMDVPHAGYCETILNRNAP